MPPISSLCVYCGSSDAMPDTHREAGRTMGRLIGERGLRLVFGGGQVGMMGVVSDAALAAGGEVIGIIPDHLVRREVPSANLTDLIVTEDMHERKARMADMSDAFAILPGGLGTLEELFEMLTWRQLRIHDKPIVLVNIAGYWDPLLALFARVVEDRYASQPVGPLITVVDTPAEALSSLGV